MDDTFDHFANSDSEQDSTHQRWIKRRNRKTEDPSHEESWFYEQCGACRFWIPLAGKMGFDWGACANPRSPFDGQVKFEHDGCGEFVSSGRWATPEDFPY
jgi:hypothetical protein